MEQPRLGLGLQPRAHQPRPRRKRRAQEPRSGLAVLQQPCLALEAGVEEASVGMGLEAGENGARLALGMKPRA